MKQETLAELKKKYKKVTEEECEEHWNKQYDSSAKTCSHAFWKGNCKNKTVGMECEVGLRRKTYNVLTGLHHHCPGLAGQFQLFLPCRLGVECVDQGGVRPHKRRPEERTTC